MSTAHNTHDLGKIYPNNSPREK